MAGPTLKGNHIGNTAASYKWTMDRTYLLAKEL